MKARFTTADLLAAVSEVRLSCLGLRVSNVYDLDNKTYLIKLSKPDFKVTVLFESGIRLHLTEFDWPKNITPSGFSMKLRKHIKNKRMESVQLLNGVDRVLDLQFGTGDYTFHLLVELYDRGNALLTDKDYIIVHLLRPRTDKSDQTKIITQERYPLEKARSRIEWTLELCQQLLDSVGNNRRQLMTHFLYGDALLHHCLLMQHTTCGDDDATTCCCSMNQLLNQLTAHTLLTVFSMSDVVAAELESGDSVLGCVTTKPSTSSGDTDLPTFLDYHPMQYRHIKNKQVLEYATFSKAVDDYYQKMQNQKLDQRAQQMEKTALKKLENIQLDHEKRLNELANVQLTDEKRGQLIECNIHLVEKALLIINSALANQLDWNEVDQLVKDAQIKSDYVASRISKLQLDKNCITMRLGFNEDESEDAVELDLSLSAYNNARKYYDMKKQSVVKVERTRQASKKAFKAANAKTQQMLKKVQQVTAIGKLRKPFWFEKFYWFVSSENYLVIGGRDKTQNELLVKRYLNPGDVYVHADLHGASSVLIKRRQGDVNNGEIPPKTLNEAAFMAVVYSSAWTAKVVTNAWWVYHDQVSKSAPTGEYLTAGSFMIRGKKNYLPPVQLIYGFGILFKIDEESAGNHVGEREMIHSQDILPAVTDQEATEEVEDLEIDLDAADQQVEEEDVDVGIQYDYGPDGKFVVRQHSSSIHDEVTIISDEHHPAGGSTTNSVHSSTKRKISAKERRQAKSSKPVKVDSASAAVASTLDTVQEDKPKSKRGQKSKMKKMKTKYKEQDDEDREMAMKLLCSAGKSSVSSNNRSAKNQPQQTRQQQTDKAEVQTSMEDSKVDNVTKEEASPSTTTNDAQLPDDNRVEDVVVDEIEEDEVEHEAAANEDAKLLSCLTGQPHSEDILHYAIPICAPYNTLSSYKYKIKLTPGTGKKGKAARSALNYFSNDKSCSSKERDLLRAIKDNEMCTPFPGKVKLSIPGQKK